MKCIALAAAGVALVGLTACSQPAAPAGAPTAAPAGSRTVAPVVPVSCSKQYHTWNRGPGKGLMAALGAISSAEAAGGTQVLTVALKKAKPAVARAARHPVPACADPRGYWDVLLMHVNAAAGGKGPAAGVRAAIKDVPQLDGKLTAELKHIPR